MFVVWRRYASSGGDLKLRKFVLTRVVRREYWDGACVPVVDIVAGRGRQYVCEQQSLQTGLGEVEFRRQGRLE